MSKRARRARKEGAAPTPPPASPPTPSTRFLLGPGRDLGLIIASPVWVVTLLFGLGYLFTERTVNLWVIALGALGHHVPGLLRAYGDRALFNRFRLRFILAPIALFSLAWAFSYADLHALVLIAFAWGVWHGIMQTYGFVRIYGVKAGVGDRVARNTDYALLVTWFVFAVVASPLRAAFLLDVAAACGVPMPTASMLFAGRIALGAATGIATLAWIAGVAAAWRRGRGPGLLRVALIVVSIGFWWFANVRVRHLLLAMPLFELFHDAQYLTIVWAFNRRRLATAESEIRGPMRALFRPTLISLALYVAAILAYGAIGFSSDLNYSSDGLTAFFTASQLLHFYYDGFIWKVRERATGAALGVAEVAPPSPPLIAPRARHALLWLLFAVPAIALAVGERNNGRDFIHRLPDVASLVPENPMTQFSNAELQWERGNVDIALAGFRSALAADPSMASARNNLTLSLLRLADDAAKASDRARLDPLVAEVKSLRVGMSDEVGKFADARLAAYAAMLP